ncbi:MAG: hypothetical protein ACK5L6_03845 [Anaerorhabdus sp.]|uniref:hypothetical protein n=1 Tax=Anaerorhabdus sp. TaxID=1872524 RepID=UPI003A8B2C7C
MNNELKNNVVKLHNSLELIYSKGNNTVIKMNEETYEILKSIYLTNDNNKVRDAYNLSFYRMFGFKVKIDNDVPINKFVIEITI